MGINRPFYQSHLGKTNPLWIDTDLADGLAPRDAANEQMRLSQLGRLVAEKLHEALEPSYIIVAELASVHVTPSSGHCYLELVERDEQTGAELAKMRANIWNRNFLRIGPAFREATGQDLEAGMKVMMAVEVTFSERYGISLNVTRIYSEYTLGELARSRQQIIEQLKLDGVFDDNRNLPLPVVVRRIAVVSAAGAAGYGDFRKQLEQSGMPFTIKLFPAVMQGDLVEPTVLTALEKIADEMDDWDVVVVIRGGGATTDLSGFDTLNLASAVAQFPIPVFTGIGHERDESILDLVAHSRFKTPTAVAAFLVENRKALVSGIDELASRLERCAVQLLAAQRTATDALSLRLERSARSILAEASEHSSHISHLLERAASSAIERESNGMNALRRSLEIAANQTLTDTAIHLSSLTHQLHRAAYVPCAQQRPQLASLSTRLPLAAARLLEKHHDSLALATSRIEALNPQRILNLGYSFTTRNGEIVTSAAALQPGDVVETFFAEGKMRSVVDEIEQHS